MHIEMASKFCEGLSIVPLSFNLTKNTILVLNQFSHYTFCLIVINQCPLCKSSCTSNDIRVIYASRLRVVDIEELHKVIP